MDKESYERFLERGNFAQEIFIVFMESLGHTFLAGDRNNNVVGIDIIEEITRSKYIHPNTLSKQHGPKLVFSTGRKSGYLMPDELFVISGNSKNNFFEVKNRSVNNLKEKMYKLRDYGKIDELSGINTFLSVVVWNSDEKGFDIYVRRIINILAENKKLKNADDCYFDLSKFKKINQNSIKP
jgi:hypothetical protein